MLRVARSRCMKLCSASCTIPSHTCMAAVSSTLHLGALPCSAASASTLSRLPSAASSITSTGSPVFGSCETPSSWHRCGCRPSVSITFPSSLIIFSPSLRANTTATSSIVPFPRSLPLCTVLKLPTATAFLSTRILPYGICGAFSPADLHSADVASQSLASPWEKMSEASSTSAELRRTLISQLPTALPAPLLALGSSSSSAATACSSL
mmetsp:Transcript_45407/g.110571  ORF Transcript_45407/g.110571 Transcript_45407/m.110571 type:complete len:209 (-) Transcript_45407:298-924(-)